MINIVAEVMESNLFASVLLVLFAGISAPTKFAVAQLLDTHSAAAENWAANLGWTSEFPRIDVRAVEGLRKVEGVLVEDIA